MSRTLATVLLLSAAMSVTACQSMRDRMAARSNAATLAAAGITPNTNSNLMTDQGLQAAKAVAPGQ